LGDRRERRRKAGHLLDLVGLSLKEAGRFPHQLSGGQKQRVFIARVLALEPSLVILDEPVSALDVSVRAQILNLLLDLRRRLGLTYLLISHDLSVVRRVSSRVGVMHRGRLVEEGPVEEVWSTPAHPYTRALLDAAPIPDPRRRPDAPSRPPAELGERGPRSGSSSCLYESNCPRAAAPCRRRRPALLPVDPDDPGLLASDGRRLVAPHGRRLVACHKP
jgi:oligopeptide/dipeptide ABC transporter ATP-binding protein